MTPSRAAHSSAPGSGPDEDLLQTDARFFGDLLTGFAARLADERRELERLHDALRKPGVEVALIEAIRAEGHRLAGASAALGFPRLALRARAVEAACRITAASYRPDRSVTLVASALRALIETLAGKA